jgi:hypothetical protein
MLPVDILEQVFHGFSHIIINLVKKKKKDIIFYTAIDEKTEEPIPPRNLHIMEMYPKYQEPFVLLKINNSNNLKTSTRMVDYLYG